MFEALEDTEQGVVLRLYIPEGRYQLAQLDTLISIITKYFQQVERSAFWVDREQGAAGVSYVFRSTDGSGIDGFRRAADRFDSFLALVSEDSASAEARLLAAGVDRNLVGQYVDRYKRDLKRLQLDIKHDYERKTLLLVQAVEADAVEAESTAMPQAAIVSKPSDLINVVGNLGPVTLQFGLGSFSSAPNVIAGERIMLGRVNYTDEDRHILDLAAMEDEPVRAAQLRSDVDRLKDPGTSLEDRHTAVQRLKGLVFKSIGYAGRKVDEVGTKLLIAYLEEQLKAGSTQ